MPTTSPVTTGSDLARLKRHEAWQVRQGFWHEHWAEYLAAYPDSFVTVKDGKVLFTDCELGSLLDRLESMGLTPADVWVEFVSKEPLLL